MIATLAPGECFDQVGTSHAGRVHRGHDVGGKVVRRERRARVRSFVRAARI
jgi:hypothetical protein